MANEGNLKHNRSPSEARENGKKGGIASGKARRRRKSMQTAAKMILHLKPTDADTIKMLREAGMPDDEMTNMTAVIVAMTKKAQAGNVQAAAFLRDTLGEGPGERSRKEDTRLKADIFEYKKDHDAGLSEEIEDITAAERSIYENEPVEEQINRNESEVNYHVTEI